MYGKFGLFSCFCLIFGFGLFDTYYRSYSSFGPLVCRAETRHVISSIEPWEGDDYDLFITLFLILNLVLQYHECLSLSSAEPPQ